MPLTPEQQQIAQRSAVAYAARYAQLHTPPGGTPRTPSSAQIAAFLRAHFDDWQGMSASAATAVAKRVTQGMFTAGRMESSPGAAPAHGEIPRDPSIGRARPEYRYVTRVVYTDASGAYLDTVGEVVSDRLLSKNEVAEQVINRVDFTDSKRRDTRSAIAHLGRGQQVHVEVILVVRR